MDYAKLAVELELKNSQYLAQLSKAQGQTTKFAGGMRSIFGGLGAFLSGAAVLGVFRAIAQETDTAMKAEAQLEAVLKSTGQAAGLSAEEITNMAAALQQQTTYGDDAILQGQNLLLTFTKIGKDVFPAATETMLDMSTALGQDLKQSAIQLGKALNDPIQGVTALRRVGIQLSKEQEAQIRNYMAINDTVSAQKVILRELATQMGGSAAAAAKTFGGSMTQLKNIIGDQAELIGKKMAPGLTIFARTLGDALTNGQGLHTVLENLGEVGSSSFARLAVTVATINVLLTRAATGYDRVFNKGGKGTALWAQNQAEIAKAEALMYKALNEWDALDAADKTEDQTTKTKKLTAAIEDQADALDKLNKKKKEQNDADDAAKKKASELRSGVSDIVNTVMSGTATLTGNITALYTQMADQAIQNIDRISSFMGMALDYQYERQLEAHGLQDEARSVALADEITDLQRQLTKTRSITKKKQIQEQLDQKKDEQKKYALQEEYEKKKNALDLAMEIQRKMMQRRQFERNKQYQIAMVWVNTAAAITAAWLAAWSLGFPVAALIMGAISTALLLANAGIQTSVIQRQQAPAFAQGVWDLQADTPATLHKNEMVMPKPFAEDFRSAVQDGGSMEEIHVHLNLEGREIHEEIVRRENKMARLLGAKSRFSYSGAY